LEKLKTSRQTDLIFGDLEDALLCLNRERNSPAAVRRSFGRFIDLSQKLTAAMRRDFSKEKIVHGKHLNLTAGIKLQISLKN